MPFHVVVGGSGRPYDVCMGTAAAWPVVDETSLGNSLADAGRKHGKYRWWHRRVLLGRYSHSAAIKGLHSSLFIDIDMLLSCGHVNHATQLKREAEKLEAGAEFQTLTALLADLPSQVVKDFSNGIWPGAYSTKLWHAVSACALSVEKVRRDFFSPGQMPTFQELFGKVERVDGPCLIVRWEDHHTVTEFPIQVAEGTNLDTVGAYVAVLRHWDRGRMIQHIRPAIQVQSEPSLTAESAFDPGDRLPDIPAEMAALYRSPMPPRPLKVKIPVKIERR